MAMKINVLYSHNNYDELFFASKTSVVIDVLRASSTIVTALQNGAKEIIPVASVEFAVKISGGLFTGQTIICGERNTKKIEGFALGNSPLEFTEDKVAGKSIIFYTTNGSRAVVKAKFSENLFVTTYLNLSAVAKQLVEMDKDFEIICSGRGNTISLGRYRLCREISYRNSKAERKYPAFGFIQGKYFIKQIFWKKYS